MAADDLRQNIAGVYPADLVQAPTAVVPVPLAEPRGLAERAQLADIAAGMANSSGWRAGLEIALERRRGRTVIAHSAHVGPLRVQRAFYPELDGACHVYILHPPGGVVAGDTLELRVNAESGARALFTTPGATKLYRSTGATACLSQHFELADGACLEWLPQETIAFNASDARVSTRVKLGPQATYAGWDIICLGRPAAGERFEQGSLRLEYGIERGGKLVWLERASFRGGDRALEAAWGLAGHAVIGTFVVSAASAPDASWLEAVRGMVEASERPRAAGHFSVTLVSGMLVARYLGPSVQEASGLFRETLSVLRPLYAGVRAVFPRIWHT